MICPLKFANPNLENATIQQGCECQKEECAWWDNNHIRCSIATIALNLGVISDYTYNEDARQEKKVWG